MTNFFKVKVIFLLVAILPVLAVVACSDESVSMPEIPPTQIVQPESPMNTERFKVSFRYPCDLGSDCDFRREWNRLLEHLYSDGEIYIVQSEEICEQFVSGFSQPFSGTMITCGELPDGTFEVKGMNSYLDNPLMPASEQRDFLFPVTSLADYRAAFGEEPEETVLTSGDIVFLGLRQDAEAVRHLCGHPRARNFCPSQIDSFFDYRSFINSMQLPRGFTDGRLFSVYSFDHIGPTLTYSDLTDEQIDKIRSVISNVIHNRPVLIKGHAVGSARFNRVMRNDGNVIAYLEAFVRDYVMLHPVSISINVAINLDSTTNFIPRDGETATLEVAP